ncbi:MAG TPA: hypothetical protein PLN71_16435 [Anaerolineae bacterium]|nr:hypothetical protein [Anaerolineae bacterium]
MDTPTITLELPAQVYADLQSLADEAKIDLVEMLRRWIKQTSEQRAWIQAWDDLRRLVQEEGGLHVGTTKEEVVEHMRKTRQEIFEAEYAHLYR